MKNWIITHSRKLVVLLLVIFLALLGVVLSVNMQRGQMMLTEEGAEVAKKSVHKDSLIYYQQVCHVLNDINDLPRGYAHVSADVMGKDTQEKAAAYRQHNSKTEDGLVALRDTLKRIDDEAPVLVRADGKEYDYKGALSSISASIDNSHDVFEAIINDKRWTNNDSQVLEDAIRDTMERVSSISEDAFKTVSDVAEEAPILSPATQDKLLAMEDCRLLTGGDFQGDDQEIVIDDIVELRQLVNTHHDMVSSFSSELSVLGQAQGVTAAEVRDALMRVWAGLAEGSREAVRDYKSFKPSSEEGTRERRATDRVLKQLAGAVEVYQGLADVAHNAWIETRDAGDEGLSDAMKSISGPLNDAQINEARFVTLAMTDMDVPTKATSEKLRAEEEKDNKVNDEYVKKLVTAVSAQKRIGDSFENLSERVNSVTGEGSGATIEEAKPVISEALSDLAGSTRESIDELTGVADEGVSSMTELADWATAAASRVTADTDGSIIRQVFDELGGVRQPESAWFAGLVTTLHEQNSVTRGQIMDQLAN